MAKFCGKCGSQLDEKTGRCPHCEPGNSPAGGERPRRKYAAAAVIVVLLLAAAAILLLFGMDRAAKPETVPTEIETTAATEPTETETTAPTEPATKTIPWGSTPVTMDSEGNMSLSMTYLGCTSTGPQGSTFYEIDPGPSVVLATAQADFDRDGDQDKLVISLEAAEAAPFHREPFGAPGNVNFAQLRLDVLFSERDGTVRQETKYESINAEDKEVISVAVLDNRIIFAKADDLSTTFGENNDTYIPVTGEITNYRDQMYIYSFDESSAFTTDFGLARLYIYNENMQGIKNIQFGAFGEGWTGFENVTLLYSKNVTEAKQNQNTKQISYKAEESGIASSEADACERVISALREIYGVKDSGLKPCSWEERWDEPLLSGQEGLICTITLTSTVSEICDDGQSTGTTTVTVEH